METRVERCDVQCAIQMPPELTASAAIAQDNAIAVSPMKAGDAGAVDDRGQNIWP